MMLEPALSALPASLARFTSLDEALAALRDRQVHLSQCLNFRKSTSQQNRQLIVLISDSKQ